VPFSVFMPGNSASKAQYFWKPLDRKVTRGDLKKLYPGISGIVIDTALPKGIDNLEDLLQFQYEHDKQAAINAKKGQQKGIRNQNGWNLQPDNIKYKYPKNNLIR